MLSIFDVVKLEMNNLGLITEFLEACDWDEEERDAKLETVIDFLNCSHLPVAGLSFDEWLDNTVKTSLIDLGLTNRQAKIILRLIINNKNYILMQQHLPEC